MLASSRSLRAAAAFALGAAAVDAAAATPSAEWNFTVSLDGRPIGTHRFVLADAGGGSVIVDSDASFDVSLLGVSIYRYRHHASERWAGGCLASLESRTDDNDRLMEVEGREAEGRFDLQVHENGRAVPVAHALPGCVMTFAYWSPALATQKRLLDPGSGRLEPVAIGAPAAVPQDLASQPVRGLRIRGPARPIDVWYSRDRWIGLDTTVNGEHRLSYRLR